MAEHREFAVSLVETTEHLYLVLARTAEEAADAAQGLFEDGDEGEILATSVESIDATSGAISSDLIPEYEDIDLSTEQEEIVL